MANIVIALIVSCLVVILVYGCSKEKGLGVNGTNNVSTNALLSTNNVSTAISTFVVSD